jgi:hypothetical protein
MKSISIALLGLVFVAGLWIAAEPVLAHHGRGTTYDTSRKIELKGTVTEVMWRNPHIAIFLDVRGADGQVTKWVVEHSNISQLARLGYGKQTVQAGMEVTAIVNPGSEGKPIGLCQGIILPNGKEVFQRDNIPAELRRGAGGLVVD